jgi:Flp pilus assembly protein TadG
MALWTRSTLCALRQDRNGISMLEFGLISPFVMVMLIGTLDVGHTLYTRSVVDGAMQEVARDSALEGGSVVAQQRIIDDKVNGIIHTVVNTATVTTTRRYYKTFSKASAAQAETYNETSGNSTCDANEIYLDANENNRWDADGADDGQGGAKDVVVITVKVDYPRLFPMATLIGMPANIHLEANTVLANQPYGEQDQYGAPVQRHCT